MACHHPWVKVSRIRGDTPPQSLPCGKCIGCFSDRARSWMIRCAHENSLHNSSSFLTLTYDDAHLVYGATGPTLVPEHLRDFFKRLRHVCDFRYFACGEYGSKTHRPHYHVLLFGSNFCDDRISYNNNSNNDKALYTSQLLTSKWGHGSCVIGDISLSSISYVTRYLLKKAQRAREARSAHRPNEAPEFQVMSRRPGLGRGWYERYVSDLYPHDNVVLDGKKWPIPRFYAEKFKLTNLDEYNTVIACRKQRFIEQERRNAAEAIQTARTNLFSSDTI